MKQNDKFYIDESLQPHMHQYRLCLLYHDCFYKGNNLVGREGGAHGHVTMEAFSKKTCPKTTTKSTPGSIHTDPFYRDSTIKRLLAAIYIRHFTQVIICENVNVKFVAN